MKLKIALVAILSLVVFNANAFDASDPGLAFSNSSSEAQLVNPTGSAMPCNCKTNPSTAQGAASLTDTRIASAGTLPSSPTNKSGQSNQGDSGSKDRR